MDLAHWVSSIVAFVRAGYPTGMPAAGHVALTALSRRRLCDDDIAAIASKLMLYRRRPITSADIGVEITRITDQMPALNDIQRVQRRLDALAARADRHRRTT
ncbi:MAG TPA: DUF3349 domain-containing protein [Mycobacterium sp.]|nr:DUF3349 domain-containing protein [Mycobacterium sp.]HTX97866.1 DUF3349 domain-containing protein [Mycobacterium sp.]